MRRVAELNLHARSYRALLTRSEVPIFPHERATLFRELVRIENMLKMSAVDQGPEAERTSLACGVSKNSKVVSV
jgi:hypothetical protein